MMKIALLALMAALAVAGPSSFRPLFKPPPRLMNQVCGLPPFTKKLSESAQLQLNEIWASYNKDKDEDCSSQLEDTKNFLDKLLTDDDRRKLRPISPPGAMCGCPPFVDLLTENTRKAIKSIWNQCKPQLFKDCSEQREATKQILDNLSDEDRLALTRPAGLPVGPAVSPSKQ